MISVNMIIFPSAVPFEQMLGSVSKTLEIRFCGVLKINNGLNRQYRIFDDSHQVTILLNLLSKKKVSFEQRRMSHFEKYIETVICYNLASEYKGHIFDGLTQVNIEAEKIDNFLSYLKFVFSKDSDSLKNVKRFYLNSMRNLPAHLKPLEGGLYSME